MTCAGDSPARRGAALVFLGLAFGAALYMRQQVIVAHGGTGDYLAWAAANYVGGITPGYLSLADELLAGRYTFLGYPPGYPAIIAALRLAGIDDLHAVRFVQAAIDSLGVPLAYFLLRRAGLGVTLSLCAGTAYAAYPLFAAGSTMLLAEFISPVFMLAGLALAVALSDREVPPRAFLAAGGFLLGAGALVRPDMLFLPFVLAAWMYFRRPGRRAAADLAIFVVASAVPVAAWGLHNRLQHGHWVFTSTAAGNALWEGLGEIPNEHGFVLDDAVAGRVVQEKGYAWLSVEADRYLRSEYLRAWRENPEFVARVIATRWKRIATESEGWLLQAVPIVRLQQLFDLGGLVLVIGALALYPRSPVVVLIVALPIAYAMASIGLTHFEPRYTRYVHLSYLFAAFLIAGLVIDRVGQLSGRVAVAGLVFAGALTAWASGAALHAAMDEANAVRAAAPATAIDPPATASRP